MKAVLHGFYFIFDSCCSSIVFFPSFPSLTPLLKACRWMRMSDGARDNLPHMLDQAGTQMAQNRDKVAVTQVHYLSPNLGIDFYSGNLHQHGIQK